MTEHLKADLLRRRREELGLQAAPAAPSQQLLRRGVLLGAAPLVLVLLLGMFFGSASPSSELSLTHWNRCRAVRRTAEQVESTTSATEEAAAKQQSFSERLLSVPSSSALLAELARLTPQGIHENHECTWKHDDAQR